VNLTQLALKAVVLNEMTAIGPFKVTQGRQFWNRSKAHIRFPVSQ